MGSRGSAGTDPRDPRKRVVACAFGSPHGRDVQLGRFISELRSGLEPLRPAARHHARRLEPTIRARPAGSAC
jgi:hypothetical protein